ncbi:MAG TPA: glycosyltransferase family 4 protein [Planctomycetaceae bacterium]|nr:glycosyltransferase family 4 protein [Planctomycetaceae bacterium]
MLTEPAAASVAPPATVRVLHTRVVTETGGGPDKTILNSPRFLVGTGYEAHCAYLYPPQDAGFEAIRTRAAAAEAPLHGILDRGAWDVSVAWNLLQLCRRLDVRIWHGHDYKTNFLGLLLRRFHRMHLVTTIHGWVKHTQRTPLYYWIDRRSLPHYDRVIGVSDDLHAQALACGVPADRCVLIENAIDTAAFQRKLTPQQARRQLGLAVERPLIGAVGRLSHEKGFDLLIDAVSRLHRDGREVDLAIAGEGDARSVLTEQIAAQPHPERFHLLGFQSDLRTLYQAMDVFAVSSRREGLPNVLLEAMSLETPVVATAIAGIPRLVADGTSGLLVPPEDVNALYHALTTLIGQPELRERLAVQGRQTIVSRYDFAFRMGKIRAVYDSLS